MLFDGVDVEARQHGIGIGICLDLRGIEVQFFAPDEPRLAALGDDRIEKTLEDGHAIAVTDPREARMIRQGLTKYSLSLVRSEFSFELLYGI